MIVDSILNKGPKPSFRLIPFHELVPGTEPSYLVKGLIPRVGLTVVWGPPKCCKSFWTFDLAMHVAMNWQYRNRRTQAGTIVYCAFEGASGFGARAEAFRLHHDLGREQIADFYLVPARANMVTDHPALIAEIDDKLGLSKQPVCVVLDTLNRSLQGSESKDEDMGAYVKAADAIREKYGCAVIIVHHCGVEGTRPRGHSSLTGAADAQIAVRRDPAGNIFTEVEWMKDGVEGEVVVSKLKVVGVGIDTYGDPITSCAVIPVDAAPAVPEAKLTQNQITMFTILHNAGPAGLTTEEWNDQAKIAGLGLRRRADLTDLREQLKAKKRVRNYGDRWKVAL